jgi:mannose-6-phosphate isomerase-like protein (cupin superfamily)
VPHDGASALALASLELDAGESTDVDEPDDDLLLFFRAGRGSLRVGGDAVDVAGGAAALVLAGEDASLTAREDGLSVVSAKVGPHHDVHAPLGPRQLVAPLERGGAQQATGSRWYQVLFGPHNGSTRATLFAGFVPPGAAPWHYHLYDEIVWILEGEGRFHLRDSETELAPGSAFRVRPREVHVVENTSASRELTLVAVFAPAGTPSAAYLAE